MPIDEDAAMLARLMIEAGRPAAWVLMMVAAYFGERGRDAALAVLEEHELRES
jgi:hypothetical protein